MSEETRKEGGFGAGAVNRPGATTGTGGQASVALATQSMTNQKRSVSRWRCNGGRSGRWSDGLCRREVNCAERACEHEERYEQAPNSRSPSCLLTSVVAHFLFSILCVYF